MLVGLCLCLLALVPLGCRSEIAGGNLVTAAAPVGTKAAVAQAKLQPSSRRAPLAAKRTFWLVAVGDIMLDRTVGKRIEANGPESILDEVREQTRAPYLTFGNLECPLSTRGPHDPYNCCFRADPKAVKVLVDGGFDVVSLANNHTLNAGREGVHQTLDTLEANGIAYVGARRERERSWEPVYFDVAGLKVGFMAYTDLSFEHGSYCKIGKDRQAACDQVRSSRRRCDLLFVSVHWGDEYEKRPCKRQKSTARALIDAGADCILGHHPHTLQGIEVYKGRPILYSMGNFVFDQRKGHRMESAIFDIWWKEGGVWQVKATPVWIEWKRLGPRYPAAERSLKIARRLRDLSQELGTNARIEASRVLVRIEP